ncbi:branched-chain amino acid transaminase [Candidatus Nitrosotenuis uzonensis]|uniref:Branched-chain-amino-acid aminotransferase n=1 Tax=Candidatus Nitrosotenuis uzonensis TaxID=1407055 RepID=V6AR91_9ARCH|nr:branched-chain amino acid transaminase [Candidatus Nitrosotenuis uzonensis]CDI05137.1 Branched-chain-amino-acid aminotransferase [Candidatus Nitrosotenuis uzonensis]
MKLAISKYVWFDGKFVTYEKAHVPITTHAIHYGTSIFEGIRAYWNGKNLNIFRLNDHIKRFRRSGQFYSISLNYTDDQIFDAAINLCKKNKIRRSCYIRPFYFVGQYGINLHVTPSAPTHAAMFAFPFGDLFNKNGISAGISSWRKFSDLSAPTLAKMGGNYLNSILATQECKRNGYDEAIMLDINGNVSEAPGENVFIVKNNTLITPPLSSSALEGITRDSVMTLADELGYSTIEKEITRSQIYLADEVFLTGTAAEIIPIINIDGQKVGDGRTGNITKQILDSYNKAAMGTDQNHQDWITPVY